jgi:AcrR family transcriptional regulator
MPRQPDPDLEGRILAAARKLWTKGGGKALTMRAVAKAARTNTPAVYRRFRDRKDVLRSLIERIRAEIIAELVAAPTPEQAVERYLDFALNHPHDYELFYQHEYDLFHQTRAGRVPDRESRPGVDTMNRKLTELLGGVPDDHTRMTLALLMLAHGAAMLMIGNALHDYEPGVRTIFSSAVQALLREAPFISQK